MAPARQAGNKAIGVSEETALQCTTKDRMASGWRDISDEECGERVDEAKQRALKRWRDSNGTDGLFGAYGFILGRLRMMPIGATYLLTWQICNPPSGWDDPLPSCAAKHTGRQRHASAWLGMGHQLCAPRGVSGPEPAAAACQLRVDVFPCKTHMRMLDSECMLLSECHLGDGIQIMRTQDTSYIRLLTAPPAMTIT
eukprot:scaffold12269_cov17-Prasinocladus_malaysianus.AAC.1